MGTKPRNLAQHMEDARGPLPLTRVGGPGPSGAQACVTRTVEPRLP